MDMGPVMMRFFSIRGPTRRGKKNGTIRKCGWFRFGGDYRTRICDLLCVKVRLFGSVQVFAKGPEKHRMYRKHRRSLQDLLGKEGDAVSWCGTTRPYLPWEMSSSPCSGLYLLGAYSPPQPRTRDETQSAGSHRALSTM